MAYTDSLMLCAVLAIIAVAYYLHWKDERKPVTLELPYWEVRFNNGVVIQTKDHNEVFPLVKQLAQDETMSYYGLNGRVISYIPGSGWAEQGRML